MGSFIGMNTHNIVFTQRYVITKMANITLSIPDEIKKRMEKYPEINWSGLIKKTIEEKVQKLTWKEEMLKKLQKEEKYDEWATEFGRKIKKNAYQKK